MRKKILTKVERSHPSSGEWMSLEELAQVEVTSEDPTHPVEAAFEGTGAGWRAADPGNQVIRLLFDKAIPLRKIRLVFREEEMPRTQEFALRWSADGTTFQEIVRQQYNFSPPGTDQEVEDYHLDLHRVAVLELVITPDKSGGRGRASLKEMRLA